MILSRVEAYMKRTRTPPARFGRDAVGDPNLVFDLRDGRQLRARTARRIDDFIAEREHQELGR